MKPIPQELFNLIKSISPAGAEVIPLSWPYEDEDYNIAVLVPDMMTADENREVETHLLDTITDYDEANGTFTVCMVWPQRDKERAGVR